MKVMLAAAQIQNLSESSMFNLFDMQVKGCYADNNTDTVNSIALSGKLYCPRTFDGYTCWKDTLASTISYQNCPSMVTGFDKSRLAHKTCTENGTWLTHPETGKPWSNYTNCIDSDDLAFQYIVKNIYTSGYVLSIVALILSVIIFTSFKRLLCTRTRVHIQLFIAMILNNFFWILWNNAVVDHASVVQDNAVWCQILHVARYFFMLCNYVWMFCEGLNLHIALVVVLVQYEMIMRYFMALGWGVSMLIIVIYVNLRIFVFKQTERCWMDASDAFWIIVVPVVLAIAGSCIFLVQILWIIVTRIKSVKQNNYRATKKAIRAALILIPLFGIHLVLIPFQPEPKETGAKLYQIVLAILTSYQGFLVSILFCFTNGEVIAAVKAKLAKMRRQRFEIYSMTGATVGESAARFREREIRENIV